ncbi:MAG: hypothetical protein WC884_04055 [Candidatus Paceibacterota bacterium]
MELKPEQFYHGSSNKDIEELEPRQKSRRNANEGELLFASPDIACATLFLVRMYDDESRKGYDNGSYYFIISNKEKFMELDNGGTVYVLPDSNFTSDPEQWDREWATKDRVKPKNKIHFDSALRAMIDNGVKVYFTDKETFTEKIRNKIISYDYLENELGLTQEK